MTEEEQRIWDEAIAYAKTHKKLRCRALCNISDYPQEDNPVSVFMAGSPGAGKTEIAKAVIERVQRELQDARKVLRIDPDDLRPNFPGYTGANSWLFQGAISIWVDRMQDLALEQRQSFILDGTFSKLDRARTNVGRSLRKQRTVSIWYVSQNPHQAWEFVQAREAQEGRHIPPKVFIEQYFGARDVVNTLKKEFGAKIEVDLLLKPNDGPGRLVVQNIDSIDAHVPEQFTRAELEATLGVE